VVHSSRSSFCPRGHGDVKGVNLPAGGLGWWCRDCASGRYSTMFFLAGDWELLEFGSWSDFWYGNDFHAAFWGWPEWISSGDEFSLTLGSYNLSVSPPQHIGDFDSSWSGWLWGPSYEDGLGIPASSQQEAKERLLAEVRQLDGDIVPRLSDLLNLTNAQARIQRDEFAENSSPIHLFDASAQRIQEDRSVCGAYPSGFDITRVVRDATCQVCLGGLEQGITGMALDASLQCLLDVSVGTPDVWSRTTFARIARWLQSDCRMRRLGPSVVEVQAGCVVLLRFAEHQYNQEHPEQCARFLDGALWLREQFDMASGAPGMAAEITSRMDLWGL